MIDPTRSADELPPNPREDRELVLARLLGELADQRRAGHEVNLEQHLQSHPELADELRGLWGAVLVADGVASFASSKDWGSDEGSKATRSVNREKAGMQALPRSFGGLEIVEELGRGGMGIVYKALQPSLGRTVAVKLLLRGDLATPDELARFRTEAQATARLQHPHIVPVFEVGECQSQPYIVMQYIEGITLSQRLAHGPLPAREAAQLLSPVCHAIHFAHEHGILHRDLKPSNILIDPHGRPHVSDFGLAGRMAADLQLTRTGAVLGTPSYMAPEQAASNRGAVGPASDVYSLGTILYQMLTGHPPFQAATPVDTVLLVLEQDPLPPRLVNPLADRDLEMVALKCLQKVPGLRYGTAQALARDLDAFLADEPIAARSGLFSQVLARWFRETHHATVLENWGLLWMWHSLALIIISLVTNWFQWRGVTSPGPYLALWTAGLGTWAAIFWALRRRAGPVTFVERQIAHVWAASMAAISFLFGVEMLLGLPPLKLSPVLALASGMVFLVKAGILSGAFYVQAAVLFATALVMAQFDRWGWQWGISLFGIVSAACFFVPGLKYHRQHLRQMSNRASPAAPIVGTSAATGTSPEPREDLPLRGN